MLVQTEALRRDMESGRRIAMSVLGDALLVDVGKLSSIEFLPDLVSAYVAWQYDIVELEELEEEVRGKLYQLGLLS